MRSFDSVDQQLASSLFQLPAEIRQDIYAAYLAFTAADFAASDTLRPMHVFLHDEGAKEDRDGPNAATAATAAASYYTPLPMLMRTCRRAYAELAPVVHETAAVRVRRGGGSGKDMRRIGIACHGVLRLERLRELVLVVDMEHANWNAWVEFFGRLAERASGSLERLIVDWGPRHEEMANLLAWRRRQHEHKENEFLRAVAGLSRLNMVWLYGGAPKEWKKRIEKDTGATVRFVQERWWKDSWYM